MNREEILDTVRDIMRWDGPDGHTDGSGVITDFIIAVLDDRDTEWRKCYYEKGH